MNFLVGLSDRVSVPGFLYGVVRLFQLGATLTRLSGGFLA